MAHEFGARLLGEVQECGLAELLERLRRDRLAETVQWTGVQYIDRLVDAFATGRAARRPGQQSESEQPARSSQQKSPRPPVIEITGASPASGKTQLLYKIAAHHLLGLQSPAQSDGDSLNPNPPSAVLYLDLSNRFSAPRLLTVLKSTLSTLPFTDASATDPSRAKEAHIHAAAREALTHIHVFRPQTTTSLLATLHSLRAYLLGPTSHYSGDRPLGAILIPDLSSFYWQDRHDGELAGLARLDAQNQNQKQKQNQDPGPARTRRPTQPASSRIASDGLEHLNGRWREVVAALRRLQDVFGCVIVGTNMALLKTRWTGEGMVVQPHLPAVWGAFVGVRVVLERERMRYLGTMSAEEVLVEQRWRRKNYPEETCRLRVNVWRCEEWEAWVRDAVGEVARRWKCTLVLGEDIKVVNERR